MSHTSDDFDRMGHSDAKENKLSFKNLRRLPKWLIISGSAILVILLAFVATAIVFMGNVTEFSILGLQQAMSGIWQTVSGWTQPITDLYDNTMKMIPGQE
jgi:hypothetical protein